MGPPTKLEKNADENAPRYLNYILPVEWVVAEIPMQLIAGARGHNSPANYNPNEYKIIFTQAEFNEGVDAEGKEILANAIDREGLLEVWVDLSQSQVTKIMDAPATPMYENMPVPLY